MNLQIERTAIIHIGISFVASLFLLLCTQTASAWQDDSSAAQQSSIGELELRSADGTPQNTALLLDTKLAGHIEGMIVSLSVEQVFKNASDQWLHGRYVFPLPSTAAIDSLTIQIGDRIIKCKIQEKEQAKKTFEKANREGKKAGLLEQHRPNLFSVAVANIAPHEEVIAKITFIDQIEYQDDVFSLRLPTTLTPRYVPNLLTSSRQEGSILGADLSAKERSSNAFDGSNNAPVSNFSPEQLYDIKAVSPPQTHDDAGKTSHTFSLDLSLNAGYALEAVRSSSHRVSVNYPDAMNATVTLANGTARLNADLVLEWQTAVGQSPKAQLFEEKTKDGYFSLLMIKSPASNATLSLPKNVTFIIDSSGSMAGEPMRQAQQALLNGLQFLSPVDRFNIIDFDSEFRTLFKTPQYALRSNVDAGIAMVNGLDADGGTEMSGALEYALRHPGDSTDANELRQVIFITDGAVYNERELFALINNLLGDARLFTVGIGSAPNTYFMEKAAQFGRGTATMIGDLKQVNDRVTKLFKTISAPVLRDLSIDWGVASAHIEHFPNKLPDLYQGEPLSLVIHSKKPLKNIKLYGRMLDEQWKTTLGRGNSKKSPNVRLDIVWARNKIADLMDQIIFSNQPQGSPETQRIEKEILGLGLRHQLLTKFTSFVAVEEQVVRPRSQNAKHNQVPNLMPKGSTMPMPQTATIADLLLWLGLLLIAIGVYLGRKGTHRV